MVFADRMEVWNPGELPPELTPELLRVPHGPMPRNPLIAEPLYLKYVEKAGTGTTDMIADCKNAGLPEPDFEQRGPYFVVTVWRDWLTQTVIRMLKLNDRQKNAILFVKENSSITNKQYQELSNVTDRTALRDIKELINKRVLQKIGTTGRATHYVIKSKPDINATFGNQQLFPPGNAQGTFCVRSGRGDLLTKFNSAPP